MATVEETTDHFYYYGLTVFLAWIIKHMLSKVWYDITCPFPNFTGCAVEVLGMEKKCHPTLYNGCNNLSMLGLKLKHVSKWDYTCRDTSTKFWAILLCAGVLIYPKLSVYDFINARQHSNTAGVMLMVIYLVIYLHRFKSGSLWLHSCTLYLKETHITLNKSSEIRKQWSVSYVWLRNKTSQTCGDL